MKCYNNFLLTVMIVAYNQKQYIAQTIESVLSQKTAFEFKILVSDDGSSDGTRDIIQSFIDKHPQKIFPVFNESNIGLNDTLKEIFPLIDTKYVCCLGGDDYWIDEMKLQKEVDVLENNPHISYVHTGYKHLYDETGEWGETVTEWKWKDKGKTGEDKLIGVFYTGMSAYPCASTACYRNEPFMQCYAKYSHFLDRGRGEGTLIHTAMCMFGGDYYFIPDVTTVYRVRKNSLSHYDSVQNYLGFRLLYTNLKIYVCKTFNIPVKKCYCFIKNDIDENLIVAFNAREVDYYKNEVFKLDLDDKIRSRYEKIFSSSIQLFIYYIYIRLTRKIFNIYNYVCG